MFPSTSRTPYHPQLISRTTFTLLHRRGECAENDGAYEVNLCGAPCAEPFCWMVSMICGFYSTNNAKGGTHDGSIHPEDSINGHSTENCTIDSAISAESFESVEILPTRAPVQPRLSYLDNSHLVWRRKDQGRSRIAR